MERKQFIAELKYFLTRALFLDIAAYLISAFFIGFTVPVAAGLLFGTAGIAVNLILLNNSIKNIVKSGGNRAQKRMLMGYLIRIAVTSAVVVISMLIPLVNMIATVIPYFYPNVVYAGKAILRKGEKSE